jgi:DNA-binding NarL/FixJ family response regulator
LVKEKGMTTKILIADDHKLMREGLRTLIEKQAELEVIAEAGDGRDAVRLTRELEPDVVIMDIAMPVLNGIEATHQIVGEFEKTKVIVLSMHADKRFVTKALKIGVSAYLLKDSAFKDLLQAIREVENNKIFLSPRITDIVINDYIHSSVSNDATVLYKLSGREREVLQLIAEGKTTKEISLRLFVSTKTIESHRKKIMDKLDIHNVAELTKYAIREGIISL